MFASVPMSSMYIFAVLGPIVVTLLVMLLVGRKSGTSAPAGWALGWRTALAGVLVPLGLVILSIPTSLFGGDKPNTTAQAAVFAAELVIVAAIAVPVLVRQWLRTRDDLEPNQFVRVFGPIYLIVLGALWISALGDYFSATNGITAGGTPTGSLVYAVICFVVSALAVAANAGATKRSSTSRSSDEVATGE
jgi:hypothetical protein